MSDEQDGVGTHELVWDSTRSIGNPKIDKLKVAVADENVNGEAVILIAKKGFPLDEDQQVHGIYYYEVHLTTLPMESFMAIGLTVLNDQTTPTYPGWAKGSFSLNSVGELYSGSAPSMEGGKTHRRFSRPFSPEDTVGCGFVPSRGDVFFTLNGKLLGIPFSVGPVPLDSPSSSGSSTSPRSLYPVVGVRSRGVSFVANFGATTFLWQGHTIHSLSTAEATASLPDSLREGNEWYSNISLEHAQKEFDEFIQSHHALLDRATRMPRKLIMKALKKKNKYFGGQQQHRRSESFNQSMIIEEDEDDEDDETNNRMRRNSMNDNRSPIHRHQSEPLSFKLRSHLDGAADLASKVGAKLASMLPYSNHLHLEEDGTRVGLPKDTDVQRLAQIAHELSQLESQLPLIPETMEQDLKLAAEIVNNIEYQSKQIRQRLNTMICETKEDEVLGDLLGLNDQLFAVIEQTSKYVDIDVFQHPSLNPSSSLSLPTKIASPPRGKSTGNVKDEGGDLDDVVRYGICEGTADSVRELLFFLRSGDEQAQLNAARALAYLVRDHHRNAEIRTWSQIDACQGGGVSTLVAVFNGKRSEKNPKLRHAIATTLVAIACGCWINVDPPAPRRAGRSSSIGSASSSPTFSKECSDAMDPFEVAGSFASELEVLVNACRVLLEQPCYCCDLPSWPRGPGTCAYTQREAALALANLCLIFHTRDKLLLEQDPLAVNKSMWSEEMAEYALPSLINICNSLIPRGYDNESSEETYEKRIAWNESRQLATFAISMLAQYPQTHRILVRGSGRGGGGIMPPIIKFLTLGRSDTELLLHAVTTLYWLCSAASPPINPSFLVDEEEGFDGRSEDLGISFSNNSSILRGASNTPSNKVKTWRSLFHSPSQYQTQRQRFATIGYNVGELLNHGTIPVLIGLCKGELPDAIRWVLIACFASLSGFGPSQMVLVEEGGLNALLSLADQALKQHNQEQIRLVQRQSSVGDQSVKTSSTNSNTSTGLNAGIIAVRRRFSSSSQKMSVTELNELIEEDSMHIVSSTNSSFSNCPGEFTLELRYLASALNNFCHITNKEHGKLMDRAEMIVNLCFLGDPCVKLYGLRTIFSLTEGSSEACDILESHHISKAILQILDEYAEYGTSNGGKDSSNNNPFVKELTIDSCLVLGNLANASMLTRARVAKNGGLGYSIGTLRRLYGLENAKPGGTDATTASRTPPTTTSLGKIEISEPQGNDIEVAHQAVRVIAGLVELVASGKSEDVEEIPRELWQNVTKIFVEQIDDLLLLTILLLGSPASVIQSEACRVLGAVTRWPAANKFEIARLALGQLVQLSIGGRGGVEYPDRQLQLNAEKVLMGLGFSEGINDVQLCGRDVQAMFSWFVMMLSLEHQKLVQAACLSAAFGTWRLSTVQPHAQKFFQAVTDQSDLVRSISVYSMTSNSNMSGIVGEEGVVDSDAVGSDGATQQQSSSPSEVGLRTTQLEQNAIEELFGFNNDVGADDDDEESLSEKLHLLHEQMKKKRFGFVEPKWLRRLVGCGLRATSVAFDDSEDEDQREGVRVFRPTVLPPSSATPTSSSKVAHGHQKFSGMQHAKREIAHYVDSIMDTKSPTEEHETVNIADFKDDEDDSNNDDHKKKKKEEDDIQLVVEKLRPGTKGFLRTLPAPCSAAFEANFPSVIERRRFLMPTGYFNPLGPKMTSLNALLPRRPLAITLPNGKDLKFRFDRIIHRLTARFSDPSTTEEDEVPHTWSLCIRDCVLGTEDFHDNLISFLLRCPEISGVTFANSPPIMDHRFREKHNTFLYANIVRNLPSSVISTTFDNVLSASELDDIANSTEVRRLLGLSIINHKFLHADVLSLIRLLAPPGSFNQATGNFLTLNENLLKSSSMRLLRLRWLDLSGNNLRDSGCARIIEALARSCKASSVLEMVNLSRNGIGNYAKETIDALIGEKRSLGLLAPHQSNLTELHLAENGIGGSAGSRLLSHLSSLLVDHESTQTCLKTLNLSRNNLKKDPFEQSLLNLVKNHYSGGENNSLYELDLCDNNISLECGKELRFAVEKSALHFLGLDGNPDIRDEDLISIESILLRNRQKWMRTILPARILSRKSDEVEAQATNDGAVIVDNDKDDVVVFAAATAVTSATAPLIPVDVVKEGKPAPLSGLVNDAGEETGDLTTTKSTLDAHLPIQDHLERPRLSVLFSVPLLSRDAQGNFHPIPRIDYEREKNTLWQTFVEASRDIDLSFGFATADRLRSDVTMKCRAIHYSGHGNPNALLFEDLDFPGGCKALQIDKLRKLVSGTNDGEGCQFVFVSACYSEYAGKAFVEAGVPHVVCVKVDARILDRAAQAFTRAFYLSLVIGDTVAKAFEIAQRNVAAAVENGESSSSKFLLLPEGGNHDVPIFPNPKPVSLWPPPGSKISSIKAKLERRQKLWTGGHLPSTPADFIGRTIETYQTLASVVNRGLTCVFGIAGVGKSSLGVVVANYANERGLFQDGILFLRLQDVSTVESLINMLAERVVDPSNSLKDTESPELRMEVLFEVLRDRNFLLILDNCDELANPTSKFRYFIGRLVDEIKGVRILVTCREPIGRIPGYAVYAGTMIKLKALSPRMSAQLFLRLYAYNHGRHSFAITEEIAHPQRERQYDMIDAISQHKLIKDLDGTPGNICDLAFAISEKEYQMMIQQCQVVTSNMYNVVQ